MSGILTNVGTFVTSAIGWMGDFVETITATGNEALFIFVVAVPLCGLGVGLLNRLIHTRG